MNTISPAPSTGLASPEKSKIRSLFDQIAFRYDLLNSILSLWLDSYWRYKTKKLVLDGYERSVLDLGIGTGKFLRSFAKTGNFDRAVGLDFSTGMLINCKKSIKIPAALVNGDFHALPFKKGSFDLIISAFTMRSVKDMPRYFFEIYESLTEHGKVAFLCLTRPKNIIVRALYFPYLKFYLPLVGKIFSGNAEAYQFLSQSVQTFQEPHTTMNYLRQTGFQSIQIKPLTFGAATLIIAKK